MTTSMIRSINCCSNCVFLGVRILWWQTAQEASVEGCLWPVKWSRRHKSSCSMRCSLLVRLPISTPLCWGLQPTSGLDAATARYLVQQPSCLSSFCEYSWQVETLGNLAQLRGATIVASIHQPRSDIMALVSGWCSNLCIRADSMLLQEMWRWLPLDSVYTVAAYLVQLSISKLWDTRSLSNQSGMPCVLP